MVTVKLTGMAMAVSGGNATLSVHTPMPKDHPLLSVIGYISNRWAHVDRLLRLAISEVSRQPINTKAHTGNLCVRLIAEAKKAGLSVATISQIESFESSIQDRVEKRNRVIHDPWFVEPNTKALGQSTYFTFAISERDGKTLIAVSDDAEVAFRETNELRGLIFREMHP